MPIANCWINSDWKTSGLASKIVTRKHVTGNISGSTYLVDLKCLGIKDTFWFFNEVPSFLEDTLQSGNYEKLDYDFAHNIVYAGLWTIWLKSAPHKALVAIRPNK